MIAQQEILANPHTYGVIILLLQRQHIVALKLQHTLIFQVFNTAKYQKQ